ncbi:D-alanine--D-alanine ligase [Breznakiellaceae bacterium SP9]
MKKLKVGILFGGKSAEHEVSLQSARNIFDALDSTQYEPYLIGIDKSGRWSLCDKLEFLKITAVPSCTYCIEENGTAISFAAESNGALEAGGLTLDVIFPILHGPFGEDGTVQGLLKLVNIPFVGVGVLGSAVGMDKDVMKRLLRDSGIPIGKFKTYKAHDAIPAFASLSAELGEPLFIKPANMGSSVGISKVHNQEELERAVADAFAYDRKIIIEEFIAGRELECSVLGNENPQASVPGEIIPQHEFYSYEAKYLDKDGAAIAIPANIGADKTRELQQLAIKTFEVLGCEGLSRVDFFLRPDGKLLVNEINTMPGFTKISMYPKLWEASGLSYAKLIDTLIQLAIKRYEVDAKLKTSI